MWTTHGVQVQLVLCKWSMVSEWTNTVTCSITAYQTRNKTIHSCNWLSWALRCSTLPRSIASSQSLTKATIPPKWGCRTSSMYSWVRDVNSSFRHSDSFESSVVLSWHPTHNCLRWHFWCLCFTGYSSNAFQVRWKICRHDMQCCKKKWRSVLKQKYN